VLEFETDGGVFVYRVVGVAIDAGRVLIHRAERDAFWALPGGHGELFEPSSDTLRREMIEELGIAVEVGPLTWVIENFFEYEGRRCHELGFYYRMTLPSDCALMQGGDGPFPGLEDDYGPELLPLIFRWHPIEALDDITLYPECLSAILRDPPAATAHLINDARPRP
jgi:8-oxo-dGTP pyrophosphatase MutT (NUDIX family)